MHAGDIISTEDALYIMLLISDNSLATMLARDFGSKLIFDRIGKNPISEDTPSAWIAFGSGTIYIDNTDTVVNRPINFRNNNIPAAFGLVTSNVYGDLVTQEWRSMNSTNLVYHRAGSINDGWYVKDENNKGKWVQVLDENYSSSNTVPTSRTINGKALSSDITLTAADVGATSMDAISLAGMSVKEWARTVNDYAIGYTSPTTTDLPSEISSEDNYAIITVKSIADGGWIEVRARYVLTKCEAVLVFNYGWGEWEWVNPPLHIEAPFRTTERYWGRPVYIFCKHYGFYNGNTDLTLAHGCPNVYIPLEIAMTNNENEILTNSTVYLNANRTNIYMKNTNSLGNVNFILKYCIV